MADILPRQANRFPFTCASLRSSRPSVAATKPCRSPKRRALAVAEMRCYGQPEKTSKFEIFGTSALPAINGTGLDLRPFYAKDSMLCEAFRGKLYPVIFGNILTPAHRKRLRHRIIGANSLLGP